MRALFVVVPTLLVLGLIAVPGVRTARADEAPADESAASKAYRDAWWAETGGGNLTQALDLYAKALEAEGPANVKARALYRRAVVLQRIGKTEEALRALERLAKDFPGETALNADARARLAEWTAVDLRSSFADWFKRYQYSPEFQAKIVDLVLKLGAGDVAATAAQTELLTIGEAAIPALRQHVGSRNEDLGSRAVAVLLLLGEVPDEVVRPARHWTGEAQAWKAIMGLSQARRETLRARVTEQGVVGDALRAVLAGEEAVLAWLATPAPDAESRIRSAVLDAHLQRLPGESIQRERLADLALADGQGEQMRSAFVYWADASGRLTAERVRAWAGHPSRALRRHAWARIEGGAPLPPAEAWPVVRAAVESHGAKRWSEEEGLGGAFLRALEGAPWPGDLDRAVAAVIKTGGKVGRTGGSTRHAEVLARVFETAADDSVANAALSEWSLLSSTSAGAVDQLLRWARSAPSAERRGRAFDLLYQRTPADRRVLILELLVDPSVPDAEAVARWGQFFGPAGAGSRGADLLGNPESARRLLDRVFAVPGPASTLRRNLVNPLTWQLNQHPPLVEPLLESVFAAPERTPRELASDGHLRQALDRTGGRDRWRRALRESWPAWTPAQRTSALVFARELLKLGEDPDSIAFLRERLRARPTEVEPTVRSLVLQELGPITLDDLRAAYDLTKTEEVDEAAWSLARGHQNQDRRLAATPEVFQALRAAIRPDGHPRLAEIFREAFGELPELQRDLASALLAHKHSHLRSQGIDLLVKRSSPADEDLWLKALGDEVPALREGAAKAMERVPTDGIKRALVGALDDPHPDVRAAALASLDAIQKHEDLKARWRERVK